MMNTLKKLELRKKCQFNLTMIAIVATIQHVVSYFQNFWVTKKSISILRYRRTEALEGSVYIEP